MSGAAAGASAGATAAAAEARRRHEEEEEMTPYGRDDLAEDWEFKILRSVTCAFKNPETLHQVLKEEAQAGWVLVEKFDNGRIRLKRPAGSKDANPGIGFDPYRTYVGPTEGKFALILLACIFGAIFAIGAVVSALVALM